MLRRIRSAPAFTLVELLVVIGIIAVLISILLTALSMARRSAQSVKCASNLRQLVTASMMYVNENKGLWPAGAYDGGDYPGNTLRWSGSRPDDTSAFDFFREPSPLLPYLRTDAVKACPSLASENVQSGVDTGNGGYGYNQAYIGGDMYNFSQSYAMRHKRPAKATQINSSTETIAYADSAFASDWVVGRGIFSYSYIEPPMGSYYVENGIPGVTSWPSIHFRHGRKSTNIAWADGHVTSERMTFSMPVNDPNNWNGIDFEAMNLGWFGERDNRLFDRR